MQLRQEQARPALAELHAWLLAAGKAVATGSGTAKAIDYALRRWSALLRYADSGTLPIDNNPVENAIRPIAVGKKNWLFAGSARVGRRAAVIQTLFATAKLNGLKPLRWLTDTLEELPAPTARWIRCCRSRNLHSLRPAVQVSRLDAYVCDQRDAGSTPM